MIYLIYGASGSGKTTLLKIIKNTFPDVSVHVKGVTRPKRADDIDEFIHYDNNLPSGKYDYIFQKFGYFYGIEKNQIEKALLTNTTHFIVCGDINTITQLKNEFDKNIKIIFIKSNANNENIINIQTSRNIQEYEIKTRLNTKTVEAIYNNNINIFDYQILNNFHEDPNITLLQQISDILEKDSSIV